MVYVLALIGVILLSAIFVKIGAVSLRMTGLDKESASFQSLSAFSGTGFTTTEAELILKHKTRRKIVKILIILGNAGMVSAIVTMIVAIGDGGEAWWSHPLAKVVLVLSAVVVIYLFAIASWFNRWLDGFIARRLQRLPGLSELLDFEAILTLGQAGMGAIDVTEGSPVAGRTLQGLKLTHKNILVLAVTRENKTHNTPAADFRIEIGDRMVCYGDLEAMRNIAIRDEKRKTAIRRRIDPEADGERAPREAGSTDGGEPQTSAVSDPGAADAAVETPAAPDAGAGASGSESPEPDADPKTTDRAPVEGDD